MVREIKEENTGQRAGEIKKLQFVSTVISLTISREIAELLL